MSHSDSSQNICVAVLEQIAIDTKTVLVEMKLDIREVRQEIWDMRQEFKQEMKDLRSDHQSDFRIVFGGLVTVAIGLAGLTAFAGFELRLM